MNPDNPNDQSQISTGLAGLRGWLLVCWFIASFGIVFFAHDLQQVVAGWPLAYWFAAQGSVLIFILIVALFAWIANRREAPGMPDDADYRRYTRRIHWRFAIFVVVFLVFLVGLTLAEQAGLRKIWVGAIFLFSTVFLF